MGQVPGSWNAVAAAAVGVNDERRRLGDADADRTGVTEAAAAEYLRAGDEVVACAGDWDADETPTCVGDTWWRGVDDCECDMSDC